MLPIALPGVVTGDVVKLLYVKDMHKNFSKTYLLTSVFIDRIIGLCGLLFLTGFISILKFLRFDLIIIHYSLLAIKFSKPSRFSEKLFSTG